MSRMSELHADMTVAEAILEVRAWQNEVARLRSVNAALVEALEAVPRKVEDLLTAWGKRDAFYDMLDEITAEVHAALAKAKETKP